jgi:exosortase K
MKPKLLLFVATALGAWALKRYYADARADDLWWMLGPTARLVTAATGRPFVMESGAGYFSREHLFLIEKSCAGINFMIAAFAMLAFVLRRRVSSWAWCGGVLAVSAAASCVGAMLINSIRIVIAMWLAEHPVTALRLSAGHLHRLEGIVVYFGGLLLLHEIALRVDHVTTVGVRS